MNTNAYTFQLMPEDNHRLANLCGPFDQHLRQIEQKLNVYIYNRGHDFQINGSHSAVEMAAKVLHHLYEETGTKTALTSNTIHLVLQTAQTDPTMTFEATKTPGIVIQTKQGPIKPHSPNQALYLDRILKHDINFGLGPAGTGKTYLAVACAVSALEKEQISRVILVRPAVEAGEKLGFLPGDFSQKLDPYFRPLYDALNDMLGFDLVMQLVEQHVIEVVPLAYMRGRTLNDAFIILDEAQNTTKEQMKMFLTRIGFNSKVVVSGDTTQTDLPRGQESGLCHCLTFLKNIKGISFTQFEMHDIVRHTLVQAILQAYAQNENQRKTD
ncbi:PhoH family protein [Rickettsiella grylli]|uniref:PhoH-like protein n=1 Tax=Rickettsiella grylli TaxID=59196 RepID=A8PNC7_9COXI|nr:PhoH family protein [Rickettsiella grylli]EDP46989.1 PhoH family protein [Rickettsiella grylli]